MDTKKLRQKILDLAIRGKLVPQDPNDEPASVLLERIRAEKEQLIKEGKIKRSKKSAATDKSHYENVPFEIPENWVWVEMSDIFLLNPKNDFNDNVDGGFIPMACVCDGYSGEHTFITKQWGDIKKGFSHFQNGDIGIAKISPCFENRKSVIFSDLPNNIGSGTTELVVLRGILVNSAFYLLLIKSDWYISEGTKYFKGVVGQQRVHKDIFTTLQVPMPPLREQQKIVDSVKNWFSVIDEIENGVTELETVIKQAKSKILDLAISGKLVPQDPEDEPAIELLKRINPAFKPCDNSHYENIEFDIPQNWVWATIGDIFEHNTGKALNASNPNGTMLDYITTSNLYWDRFELSIIKQMPFTESEIERCIVRKGDLLICEGGDVGRAAIWDYDYNIMIQNHIHRLRGKVDICTRYFFYLFMHYKLHNLIGGKGVAIQGLSSRDLHNLIIPVPSLKEQYDIASSIDLYFSKLDMITAEL